MDEGNSTEAVRAAAVRRRVPARLVVAAVRPFRPDVEVIRSAARLAADQDAELLVLAILRRPLIDCAQMVAFEAPTLDATRGELFANTVEMLLGHDVAWSVRVSFGAASREIADLARRSDVRAVVVGHRGRRWRRVAGQFRVVSTR
jgi:nucleotide-binding universal stress UspA family protein